MTRRKQPKTWGGARKGSGRPALYPGKVERQTYRLTAVALAAIAARAAELSQLHDQDVTTSDALDDLVRQASGQPRVKAPRR